MRIRSSFVLAAILYAAPALAQTAPSHGWIDVNYISLHPAQDAQTFTFKTTIASETASAAAAYPKLPTAKGGEVGFGVRIGDLPIGVGIHVVKAKFTYPAGLAINLPHPLFFNRFAQDSDVATGLEREDLAVDVMGVFVVPTPSAWSVRVFGGPTRFTVKQDMVSDVRYDQFFNLLGGNIVDLTGHDQTKVEGHVWGFNAGADVAYFFTRYIGVGGTVRVNGGTVSVDKEPLSEAPADFKAGGAQFGGGLRIRF